MVTLHPLQSQFQFLPSGWRFLVPKCWTTRFKNSFVQQPSHRWINYSFVTLWITWCSKLLLVFSILYYAYLLSVVSVLRVCMWGSMIYNCKPDLPTGTNKVTWTWTFYWEITGKFHFLCGCVHVNTLYVLVLYLMRCLSKTFSKASSVHTFSAFVGLQKFYCVLFYILSKCSARRECWHGISTRSHPGKMCRQSFWHRGYVGNETESLGHL